MSFNPCLIGGWCVGECRWSTDPYRGICKFDPYECYNELVMDDELEMARKLYDEWIDYFKYIEYGGEP